MELEAPLKAQIPGVYTIPLEEGFHVTLTNPSSDLFIFSSTLGSCPSEEKEAFFSQLLLANLFGQGTRGAILGLDSEANLLTLTLSIDYHIDYNEFKDLVEDFLNAADFWRAELAIAGAPQ